MKACHILCMAVLGLAATVPEAKAVLLPPNDVPKTLGPVISPPSVLGPAVDALTDPFTNIVNGKKLKGTLYSYVYRLTGAVTEDGVTYHTGDLVFGYKLTLLGGTQKATGIGIGGYNPAAGTAGGKFDAQLITPAAFSPKSASYDGSVETITVNFSPSLTASGTSTQLLIFTKDKFYTKDFASVLGTSGTSSSALPVFTPFTATPEPGTIALACAGLPVLGLYQLLRRRRAKNA
jgi:hypothetical protein